MSRLDARGARESVLLEALQGVKWAKEEYLAFDDNLGAGVEESHVLQGQVGLGLVLFALSR